MNKANTYQMILKSLLKHRKNREGQKREEGLWRVFVFYRHCWSLWPTCFLPANTDSYMSKAEQELPTASEEYKLSMAPISYLILPEHAFSRLGVRSWWDERTENWFSSPHRLCGRALSIYASPRSTKSSSHQNEIFWPARSMIANTANSLAWKAAIWLTGCGVSHIMWKICKIRENQRHWMLTVGNLTFLD